MPFDGAVGIFSVYGSIASQHGKRVSLSMIWFHESAENYERTESRQQYKEAHQRAIEREMRFRQQRPDLGNIANGWGRFDV